MLKVSQHRTTHLLASILFASLLLCSGAANEAAADCDGGTPGYGGAVPTIQVGALVAGDTAFVTVDNISTAASGVYVGFSLRESCRDVSSRYGTGARIGPALVDVPGATPPFRPILYAGLQSPRMVFQKRIPRHWGNRTLHVQALVADPYATGGLALSDGISIPIQKPAGSSGQVIISGLLSLPSPRSHIGSEYDARTGLIHVFGPDVTVIDTTRPSSAAIRSTQETFPSERSSVATVTDPSTGLVYVFGGSNPSSRERFRDIVAFDYFAPIGRRMTVLPDTLPTPLSATSAVWDEDEGVAYLFGGINDLGRATRDVMRFDPNGPVGGRLTVLADQMPNAGFGYTAVYDSRRRLIYVAGGDYPEILDFSPSRPTGSRFRTLDRFGSSRREMSAHYDAARDQVFFFGGVGAYGVVLSEIASYSPNAPAGTRLLTVAELPAALGGTSAVRDPLSDRILILGGYSATDGPVDRIVEFRPPDSVRTLGGFLDSVELGGAVSDPRTGKSYVFDNAVYVVDPSAPFGQEVRVTADLFPSQRRTIAATWDSRRNVAYLFGGYQETTRLRLREILEFDPARPEGSRFTPLPDSLPTGLAASSAAWDSNRGVVYLFGGVNEEGRQTRQIIRFDPAAAPGGRVSVLPDLLQSSASSLAVVYEASNDAFFVMGDGTSSIFSFQPWAPAGSRLRQIGSLPQARSSMAAVADPSRGSIFLFGGRDALGNTTDEIFEFDPFLPPQDSVMQIGTLPLERAYSTAVYWQAREKILIFGGTGASRDIRLFEY